MTSWAAHDDDRDIDRCGLCGSWRHRDSGCPIHDERRKGESDGQ